MLESLQTSYYDIINTPVTNNIIPNVNQTEIPIGRGSFGNVLLGVDPNLMKLMDYGEKNDDNLNIIKTECNLFPDTCYVKKEQSVTKDTKLSIEHEINVLKLLNSEKTVDFIKMQNNTLSEKHLAYIFAGSKRICKYYNSTYNNNARNPTNTIILQYYPTTLADILKNSTFSYGFTIKLTKQILCGLAYMHSLNICHSDLKLQNITLDGINNKLSIKIIDFGASRIIINDNMYLMTANELSQTASYVSSPTIADPHSAKIAKCNVKNDIWSLAMIFFEMITKYNIIHLMMAMKGFKSMIDDELQTYLTKYGFEKIIVREFMKNTTMLFQDEMTLLENAAKHIYTLVKVEPMPLYYYVMTLANDIDAQNKFITIANLFIEKALKDKNMNEKTINNAQTLFASMANFDITKRLSVLECLDLIDSFIA